MHSYACMYACMNKDAQCLRYTIATYMSPINSSLSYSLKTITLVYFYSASSLFSILQCIIVVPKIL